MIPGKSPLLLIRFFSNFIKESLPKIYESRKYSVPTYLSTQLSPVALQTLAASTKCDPALSFSIFPDVTVVIFLLIKLSLVLCHLWNSIFTETHSIKKNIRKYIKVFTIKPFNNLRKNKTDLLLWNVCSHTSAQD